MSKAAMRYTSIRDCPIELLMATSERSFRYHKAIAQLLNYYILFPRLQKYYCPRIDTTNM